MNKNVGGYDRLGRLVLGPLLVLVGVLGYVGVVPLAVGPLSQALASLVVAVIGAVLAVTGATRACPLYSVVGFSTSGRSKERTDEASSAEDSGTERPH